MQVRSNVLSCQASWHLQGVVLPRFFFLEMMRSFVVNEGKVFVERCRHVCLLHSGMYLLLSWQKMFGLDLAKNSNTLRSRRTRAIPTTNRFAFGCSHSLTNFCDSPSLELLAKLLCQRIPLLETSLFRLTSWSVIIVISRDQTRTIPEVWSVSWHSISRF